MSHPAQIEFCEAVKERFPKFFVDKRVLEIGSRNINGSVRTLFEECEYTGIDAVDGKGVDIVAFGHEYEADPESFNVVCSTETLEHDPHAKETVVHMMELLRPGGLIFITCATENRPEHGTRRTGKRYGPDADHYRNVSAGELLEWTGATEGHLTEVHVEINTEIKDVYLWGIKR